MEPDIVVVGATGFTGQLVVEHLATLETDVPWLISARSQEKLTKLVENLKTKGVDISHVPQLIVDTTNEASLTTAVNKAKVVLNCVGPNTSRSEDIVQACIRCRTHYIDMSAEVNHIFKLHMKYHKMAEEANVMIIPACGYSSLLTASGLLYLRQQFHGTLNTVECYLELGIPKRAYIPLPGNCLVSYGTWNSLVHVMRNMKEYQQMKTELYPPIEPPEEMKRGFFHCSRRKLWYPYPGADENVIEMSERYLHEKGCRRPAHFRLYTTMPLFFHYLIIPAMFLYYYLSFFDWFANLLWKYPRLFTLGYMSRKGPSEKNRENTTYSLTYIGKGWDKDIQDFSKPPNKTMKVKVSSNDPYKTTAKVMIAAAITLLKEPFQMPSGGVVNVGAAFENTTINERLINTGIKYEVLPKT